MNKVNSLIHNFIEFQIMLCLAMTFVLIVFCLFSTLQIIMLSEGHNHLEVFFAIIWIMIYSAFPSLIIFTGHFAKEESKKTSSIVHKIINFQKNKEINNRLMEFSQQIMNRFSEFSSGLFSYDLTLLYSVIKCIN